MILSLDCGQQHMGKLANHGHGKVIELKIEINKNSNYQGFQIEGFHLDAITWSWKSHGT